MENFELQEVSFYYPDVTEEGAFLPRAALSEISFSVHKGEFLLLCGGSGSGKSTLLRLLKPQLAPYGKRGGRIRYEEEELAELPKEKAAFEIGFVMQNPDNQIVTDKVWHELAFGLENMGMDPQTMRLRVAEMASFFGIQSWFHQSTDSLSGGQKQMLNLAAVMVMQPKVLLLDEPTSQLDPIAARDFLRMVKRIQEEFGTTIVMSEHRMEEVFPMAERVLFLEEGKVRALGSREVVTDALFARGLEALLPTQLRIYKQLNKNSNARTTADYPVTIHQGRRFLAAHKEKCQSDGTYKWERASRKPHASLAQPETILEAKNLFFAYERGQRMVLQDLSLQVKKGEILAILGGNGTGKTTLLSLLAGVNRPLRGKIKTKKDLRISMLSQNPLRLFAEDEVGKELERTAKDTACLAEVIEQMQLEELLSKHPYDLSGGEQQKAALAKILLMEPDLLLLDEPTKGIDGIFKETMAEIFRKLLQSGKTIVLVSHDVEFCGAYAHRCGLVFDGSIVSLNERRAFFEQNSFYTTAANRMSREIIEGVVTAEDVTAHFGDV